jgi:hypothetical protein
MVRLSPGERAELEKKAKTAGLTLSEAARAAFTAYQPKPARAAAGAE